MSTPTNGDPTRRPWGANPEEIAKHGPWSDYSAWQRWIAEISEREAPNGTFLDPTDLDYEQAIGLYVVMCKLADGELATPTEPRP